MYQKSSYYTELLGDAALIATAVGGGIKICFKAASYCVAELGSMLGSMSSKAVRSEMLGVLEGRVGQLTSSVDGNQLSKAGQVMDRGALTIAGRGLQKHGGRSSSVFMKPRIL